MIFQTPSKMAVVKYALLPQLVPRMRALLGKGFEFIPYLIALVYQCVRLLPPSHPYVDPRNIGRFGLRHVVAEAANNLILKAANLDQIILFLVVLVGIVLAGIQIFLLALALFIQPAAAALPTSFSGFFLVPAENQAQDMSYIMLDLIFGVEGMFNSCIAGGTACLDLNGNPLVPDPDVTANVSVGSSVFNTETWPYPIHGALHELFRIYSLGLLVVAVIVTLYFMFTVVAETAQTGTAFGKRFNKVWAPLRIVMAFGLLVPIGQTGLNSAQYIVLYAAKFGTGFATNGWILFNQSLSKHYFEETNKLVATPQVPEIGELMRFMFVARTCYEADMIVNASERTSSGKIIKPYSVVSGGSPSQLEITGAGSYDALMSQLQGENIATIRFGIHDEKDYAIYKGNVAPICGELTFSLAYSAPSGHPKESENAGTIQLQRAYLDMIARLWYSEYGAPTTSPGASSLGIKPYDYACANIGDCGQKNNARPSFSPEERMAVNNRLTESLKQSITAAVDAQNNSGRFNIDENLKKKGWPAAAIWYNRIAEMNGAVTTAVFKVPMPAAYPESMEYLKSKRAQYDQNVAGDRCKTSLANNEPIRMPNSKDQETIKALCDAFNAWQTDGVVTNSHTQPTGNLVIDIINAMFGTNGLYDMRKDNGVHPLAKLSALGKSLVDSAINNIGYAAMGAGAGGLLSTLAQFPGTAASVVSGMLISFAMIGLTFGFILYYIVPFLPFIYFFFAFGGWIKAIFEAMVGTPLWALAHIRIDGDGLPGRAAMGGYFLIFEIFLRPILTIFGFIASITIFAALVETLNEIFTLVTANVAGYDAKDLVNATPSEIEYYRGPVDEFFYTVIYAVVVYMMGMSSFKLIDQIPNGILRWMGQTISPFGREDDAAEGLISNTQVGLNQGLDKLGGGLSGLAGQVSNLGSMVRK